MKRTTLRRTPFRSARTKLRRADDRQWQQVRKLVFERDVHCVVCDEPGWEVHHRLPRGAGGALHDPTRHALSRLVLLCGHHHRLVESQRAVANFLGLIVRHGATLPAAVPVFHHQRWVTLDDHGCVLPMVLRDGADRLAAAYVDHFLAPNPERSGPWGFNA